jgi:hypothetical protein
MALSPDDVDQAFGEVLFLSAGSVLIFFHRARPPTSPPGDGHENQQKESGEHSGGPVAEGEDVREDRACHRASLQGRGNRRGSRNQQ